MFSSPSLLSNLQLLDGPAGHSLGSPFTTTSSSWSASPFSVTPLHTSASLYAPAAVFSSSRDEYSPPLREGVESPQLQDALKDERLSPAGGSGVISSSSSSTSSFLNLTPATGSVYTTSSHSSSHMLNPYSSYVGAPGDFGSAGFYSNPGAWINTPYSAKLHNKMRISTPGESKAHAKVS